MTPFNYRMLTLAREARGYTQLELAKRSVTDQGYLSKVEKGLLKPTDDILEKYSSALDFPLSFFSQEGNKTVISDFFYRKRISIPVKEKTMIEAQIDLMRLLYEKLLKSVEIPEPKFPSVSVSGNFTPKDAAIVARQFYKIPKGAIKNITTILEKNGIGIIFINSTSDKFDGMTVYTDSNYPIIVLNKNMPNDRKRFTIAHELGHQIMHMPHLYTFELYERLNSDPNALEKEADSFASEFLMPEKECFSELLNLRYNDLGQLKLYWHVSKKAIIYRAKTIKAIGEDRYRNLLIELSRRGERVKEDFEVFLDEPKLMRQILEAYRTELKYSQKELSNYLSISDKDLVKIINENNGSKLRIAV